MIGGLKTVSLAWVNKIAVIGYTWLFVYETALIYEGRMNAAPENLANCVSALSLSEISYCFFFLQEYTPSVYREKCYYNSFE